MNRCSRHGPEARHRLLHLLGVLRDEEGQITAFVVVVMLGLLAIAGVVWDGGQALGAHTTAIDEAQEASRAGAQAIDLATYRATGTLHLNPTQAEADARAYLAATGTGDTATITVTATTVTVTVTHTQPTAFLRLAGISSLTVNGTATAAAEAGVTGPNQLADTHPPLLLTPPGRLGVG